MGGFLIYAIGRKSVPLSHTGQSQRNRKTEGWGISLPYRLGSKLPSVWSSEEKGMCPDKQRNAGEPDAQGRGFGLRILRPLPSGGALWIERIQFSFTS